MKAKLTLVLISAWVASSICFPQSAAALDGIEQSCRRQMLQQLASASLAEQEMATWLGAIAVMNNPERWRALLRGNPSPEQQQRAIATVLCTKSESPRHERRCPIGTESRLARFRRGCSI